MEDMLEQTSEIMETLGRPYGLPDDVDEDDLEAGESHDHYIIEYNTAYLSRVCCACERSAEDLCQVLEPPRNCCTSYDIVPLAQMTYDMEWFTAIHCGLQYLMLELLRKMAELEINTMVEKCPEM